MANNRKTQIEGEEVEYMKKQGPIQNLQHLLEQKDKDSDMGT
jgi:hypothetical protein